MIFTFNHLQIIYEIKIMKTGVIYLSGERSLYE